MKRMLVLVFGVVALIALVLTVQSRSDNAPVASPALSAVADVAWPAPRPAPEPRFTRTMYAASELDESTKLVDECNGPVAVWLGEERPTLVAEHDYCGGSLWMSRLKVGEAVKLDGEGVDDGIFVVTSLTYETRNEVTVGDLPEADLVLQTCVTKTRLVLVGMERFEA